jgi:type III secretory pathway component EscV
MARENQGLQIALIIFVMLTIILGVTTFIFVRQYQEADQKAEAKTAEAFSEHRAATNLAGERMSLLRMTGLLVKEDEQKQVGMDEITTKFNQDMQTYGGNFPEDKHTYHDLLGYLYQTIQDKNIELADLKVEVQDWKDKDAKRPSEAA